MHVKKQPAAARSGAPGQPPAATPSHAQPPPPVESPDAGRATLADLFQREYYRILADTPGSTYRFYYEESVVSRSDPSDLGVTPPVTGIIAINHKILNCGLAHAQTIITSVDHQDTASGILVVVAGTMALKGEPMARRFVQVFMLVNRSNSYYISNDVHRLLDTAPAAPPPIAHRTLAACGVPLQHAPQLVPHGAPNGGAAHDPAVLAIAAGQHAHLPAAVRTRSAPAGAATPAGGPPAGVAHSGGKHAAPAGGAPPAPAGGCGSTGHAPRQPPAPTPAQHAPLDSGGERRAAESGKPSSWAAVASKAGGPVPHRQGDGNGGEAEADEPMGASSAGSGTQPIHSAAAGLPVSSAVLQLAEPMLGGGTHPQSAARAHGVDALLQVRAVPTTPCNAPRASQPARPAAGARVRRGAASQAMSLFDPPAALLTAPPRTVAPSPRRARLAPTRARPTRRQPPPRPPAAAGRARARARRTIWR